ncbi:MAG: hypothetical protein ABH852_06105 [Methanobacteriota archaeon]
MRMPRSREGKEAHMLLVKLAGDRLKSMHYEVTCFPRLNNKKWADMIASSGKRKIVVECLITAPQHILKRKLKNYKDFDKIIFVLPSRSKFPLEKNAKVEVWRFDVGRFERNIYPISLTDENHRTLCSIAARSKISKAEAIRRSIQKYAEYLQTLEVITYRKIGMEQTKREVEGYLKGKASVRADEISEALRIDFGLVNKVLLEMWEEGWVEPQR